MSDSIFSEDSVSKEVDRLWENSGHGTRECDIKNTWNAAIKLAAEMVRENHDEQEPWIDPEDIESLYVTSEDKYYV